MPITKIDMEGLQQEGRNSTPGNDSDPDRPSAVPPEGHNPVKEMIHGLAKDFAKLKERVTDFFSNETAENIEPSEAFELDKTKTELDLANEIAEADASRVANPITPDVAPEAEDSFWPVPESHAGSERGVVSGQYRNFGGSYHGAVDIAMRENGTPPSVSGAPVYATHPGKVVVSQSDNPTAGNFVVIENGNVRTRYLHLQDTPLVNQNDSIERGTQLGNIGSTGRSEAPHLHYEIKTKQNGSWQKINPVVGDSTNLRNFNSQIELKNPMDFR